MDPEIVIKIYFKHFLDIENRFCAQCDIINARVSIVSSLSLDLPLYHLRHSKITIIVCLIPYTFTTCFTYLLTVFLYTDWKLQLQCWSLTFLTWIETRIWENWCNFKQRSERKAEIANMYHPFARIVSGPTVKDLFIKQESRMYSICKSFPQRIMCVCTNNCNFCMICY